MTTENLEVNNCISLMLDKDRIISIITLWKTGAAYMLLDPSYPSQRIQPILKEIKSKILLTTTKYANQADIADSAHIVALDSPDIVYSIKQQPTDNLNLTIHPRSLAYVIYTSGTTSRPKGVHVEQRSVLWLRDALVK
ncbi:hypothetical protein BBP40_005425 [Aspergillus hancockii]|nr:hypothetical protein BBP40_005425 [Aspergillus hancockii]